MAESEFEKEMESLRQHPQCLCCTIPILKRETNIQNTELDIQLVCFSGIKNIGVG